MKAVADAVGMTSAALYRHFENKQDMFEELVRPAQEAVEEWTRRHQQASVDALGDENFSEIWEFDSGSNDVRLVLDVMYEQPELFRLMLFRSAGTRYENWVEEMIESSCEQMMDFVAWSRQTGHPAREVSHEEMHILVTAYLHAMIEPIAHGFTRDEAEKYLRTMMEFFTPGWRMITGL